MPAADPMTRTNILDGAVTVLQRDGLADLSIRKVAPAAGVPLSQVHYHFGSKQGLVLAILARDSERLLARQTEMYSEDVPLWKQWEEACDFYDDDLASGYVRNLQEMIAAGWSDPEVAEAVRDCNCNGTSCCAGSPSGPRPASDGRSICRRAMWRRWCT